MTWRESIFIPIYVPKLISDERLRKELGIPEDAKVSAGMAGGTLLISPFAWKAAVEHARNYTEDHFVFLNTEPIRGCERFLNIHYLSATVNPVKKTKFLATCDAMLHARWHGETFGLAVGEFAVLGKPVITFSESRERAHLEMLGKQSLLCRNAGELVGILREFRPHNTHGNEYNIYADPEKVMQIFAERFLS